MSGPPTSMGTSPTALTSLNSPFMVWSIGSVESVSLQVIRLMSSMSVIRMTFTTGIVVESSGQCSEKDRKKAPTLVFAGAFLSSYGPSNFSTALFTIRKHSVFVSWMDP